MESKHTPLPWEVHKLSHCQDELWLQIGHNGSGPIVRINSTAEPMAHNVIAESKYMATSEEEQIANAEFIVKACNSYYDMLEALEKACEFMKYSEAAELIEELVEKEWYNDAFIGHTEAYKKGMEDIIRVLCDKGVIDNSDELKREKEGGF